MTFLEKLSKKFWKYEIPFYRDPHFYKRIIWIAAAVLAFSLVLKSCVPVYEYRYVHGIDPSPMEMEARTHRKTFSRNSFTLELRYGLHENTFDWKTMGIKDYDPKMEHYDLPDDSRRVEFALYLGSDPDALKVAYGEDYRAIPGLYLVKEIGEDEGLSNQYKFSKDLFGNIQYKHRERITVPEVLLDGTEGEEGTVCIFLCAFVVTLREGQPDLRSLFHVAVVEIDFKMTDSNRIQLT